MGACVHLHSYRAAQSFKTAALNDVLRLVSSHIGHHNSELSYPLSTRSMNVATCLLPSSKFCKTTPDSLHKAPCPL